MTVSMDASSAKTGAAETRKEVAGIGQEAASTETKMQRLVATATGLHVGAANNNQRAWTGALAAEGLALDNLRAKYNPLFAVIRQYKAVQAEIRTAHAMGALSANEMTAALQRQRQATLASIDVIKGRNAALASAASIGGASARAASAGGGNFAATNAMFQLQDVAMTAAMGMNPGMIALQQGSQLAGVFAGQTLKQTGATLLSAFTQLLSPVALATVAVTGLSAAAIQYFTRAKETTDGMSADLREQADLIARVANAWGDATPQIKAYADEMEKAANAADRLKAGEALAGEKYNSIGDVLGGLRQPFGAARSELSGYGADAAPALRLMTDAVTDLQMKIAAGTATTNDLDATQRALAETLNLAGTPAVRRFVDEFTKVAPQIKEAVEAARQFRQEGSGSILPQLGRLSQLFSEGGRLYSPEDFIPRDVPIPTRRPLIELEGLPGAVEAEKALAEAKRDRIRSMNESIERQQLELFLIGRTVSESEALRMQYQLTAALKAEAAKNGTAIDQEELRLIEEKSRAYGQLAEQIAATNIIRGQETALETLRAEISLIGQSEEVRRRALALLQAEQRIKQEGISVDGARAQAIRRNADAEAQLRLELEKSTDAWNRYRSAGEGAIDTIFDGLSSGDFDVKSILKNVTSDLSKFLMDMPIKTPLRTKLCEGL